MRAKKGHPPQRTTGVASASSIQASAPGGIQPVASWPASIVPMVRRNSGAVRTALPKRRRVMSLSSGLSGSSAVTVRGSKAIPQMGQEPGSERTTSGCMGQTYSVLTAGATSTGSSAIPHIGHGPGFSLRTSGCMGQV